jgi:hypothetical protein
MQEGYKIRTATLSAFARELLGIVKHILGLANLFSGNMCSLNDVEQLGKVQSKVSFLVVVLARYPTRS